MGFYGLYLLFFYNFDIKKVNYESICIVFILNFIFLCNIVVYK